VHSVRSCAWENVEVMVLWSWGLSHTTCSRSEQRAAHDSDLKELIGGARGITVGGRCMGPAGGNQLTSGAG
jgi:hypothetical protein